MIVLARFMNVYENVTLIPDGIYRGFRHGFILFLGRKQDWDRKDWEKKRKNNKNEETII